MLERNSLEYLQAAIARYRQIFSKGGWPQLPPGRYDDKSTPEAVLLLRQRLAAEGYVSGSSLSSSAAQQWDAGLKAGLKTFQQSHGALPTGVVDVRTLAELNITAAARFFTLQENLPRVSEHLQGLGPRYVAVNIPAAQLETVENGQIWSRHNVVVGKTDHPTPSLKSRATSVEFNPTWTVPESIIEKELIPKLERDHEFLQKNDMHVFDRLRGYEIDAATISWRAGDANRYLIVQNPGEQNSLSEVKVNFPNKYSVYMHDTPHRSLFETNDRWESHGCVRVDQVIHLITWLMNGQDGYTEDNFEPIISTRKTQEVKLKTATDIRFMYLTAWATGDGRIHFRPDFYRLSGLDFVLGQPEPVSPG
jgi:murein L,D-transpeptidase YcbB/YkuD